MSGEKRPKHALSPGTGELEGPMQAALKKAGVTPEFIENGEEQQPTGKAVGADVVKTKRTPEDLAKNAGVGEEYENLRKAKRDTEDILSKGEPKEAGTEDAALYNLAKETCKDAETKLKTAARKSAHDRLFGLRKTGNEQKDAARQRGDAEYESLKNIIARKEVRLNDKNLSESERASLRLEITRDRALLEKVRPSMNVARRAEVLDRYGGIVLGESRRIPSRKRVSRAAVNIPTLTEEKEGGTPSLGGPEERSIPTLSDIATESSIEHLAFDGEKDLTRKEKQTKLKRAVNALTGLRVKERLGKGYESSKGFLAARGRELGLGLERVYAQLYLAGRNAALDLRAADLALAEKTESGFRWIGEKYDKVGLKTKIAASIGLGFGSGALLAGGSVVAGGMLLSGIFAQRVMGLSSSFLKYEKKGSGEEQGTKKFLGLEYGEKERAMWKAMKRTILMTGGMLALVEGSEKVFENYSTIKDWLGNAMGHHSGEPGSLGGSIISHNSFPGHEAISQPPPYEPAQHFHLNSEAAPAHGPIEAPMNPAHAESIPAHASAAGAAHPNQWLNFSQTPAHGHGYEWMEKRIWDHMQELHADASHYPPGSDAYQLAHATPESVNKLVHELAEKHNFFHADGKSVLISPDARLSFGQDGMLHLSQHGMHDVIQAPDTAPTTPVFHPEASVVHAAPLHAPEVAGDVQTPVSGHGTVLTDSADHPVHAGGADYDPLTNPPKVHWEHHVTAPTHAAESVPVHHAAPGETSAAQHAVEGIHAPHNVPVHDKVLRGTFEMRAGPDGSSTLVFNGTALYLPVQDHLVTNWREVLIQKMGTLNSLDQAQLMDNVRQLAIYEHGFDYLQAHHLGNTPEAEVLRRHIQSLIEDTTKTYGRVLGERAGDYAPIPGT